MSSMGCSIRSDNFFIFRKEAIAICMIRCRTSINVILTTLIVLLIFGTSFAAEFQKSRSMQKSSCNTCHFRWLQ